MKNVLEQPNHQLEHIHKIKAEYLEAEIGWMQKQSLALLDIINLYKRNMKCCAQKKENQKHQQEVKNIEGDQQIRSLKQISPKIKESLQIIQKQLIEEKPKLLKQESLQDHCQLSKEQIWRMIFTFEEEIQTLKDISRHDEKVIQQYELEKQNKNYFKDKVDHSSIMKTAESYNVAHKVIDKYKRRITNLKIRRKNLQKQMSFINLSSQQKENTLSEIRDKSSFLISELDQPVPRRNREVLTGFEQALLIYKKKKYLNQQLKTKNSKLKLAIADKQAINIRLQKALNEQEWNQFNFSQFVNQCQNNPNGNNNFSILNSFTIGTTMKFMPRIYQSFRFDQDISKIIPS